LTCPLTKPSRPKPNQMWAFTVYRPIWPKSPLVKAQSELGSHKSKAQLKWAPATSKVPLQLSSPPAPEEQCPFSWTQQ
jgi:hypothetical protein